MSATSTTSQDERIQRISWWRRLLSRPDLGAFAGAILIFIFFAVTADLFAGYSAAEVWECLKNLGACQTSDGASIFSRLGDTKGFLGIGGVMNWLELSAQLGILAIGATLLMIGGEFDLSVGSMIAAAGAVFLYPVVFLGVPVSLSIVLVVLFALLIGLINGLLVNRTGLPSFIVTLAFLYILRGLTLGLTRLTTNTTQISVRSLGGGIAEAKVLLQQDWLGRFFAGETLQPLFSWFFAQGWIPALRNGKPAVTGVPVSIIWWLVIAVIAVWVLRNTKFGNWIFAVGGNADAARNAGVPVQFVRIVLFMITALCATIFALLQVMDLGSTDTTRGQLKEFEAIIIAVIGGTLLTGGYGSVVGAIFGALIFGMTSQGIFFAGWNTDWFKAILGALLLAAVLFNNFLRKRAMGAK